MSSIKEDTMEFLEKLPKVNSVTTYGSGYFSQGEDHEIQALDLIVSVDDASKWHDENSLANPEMYLNSGDAGLDNLMSPYRKITFPRSLGCFFTEFNGREFKLLVTDKELLYDNLKKWGHLSLPGRMQKPMKILIDNSDEALPELMKFNYESALKTALLMHPEEKLSIEDLFETIASLSYIGDIRTVFNYEDPNKIRRIVEGSHDFFEETYGNSEEFERIDETIIKSEMYDSGNLFDIIDTLPEGLKKHLNKSLWGSDIENKEMVAKATKRYILHRNFADSILLALRCNQTVGKKKSTETRQGKKRKNKQKVKK